MYRRSLLFLCLFTVFASMAFCQSTTGTLVGTVTDTAGGTIAGAKVIVTNLGTNAAVNAVTNKTGDYKVTNLVPGPYRIHFEMASFSPVDVGHVTLLINQTFRTDVKLAPGNVQQSVEITASAPVVQTETSSVASVLDTHTLVTLPTNGQGRSRNSVRSCRSQSTPRRGRSAAGCPS